MRVRPPLGLAVGVGRLFVGLLARSCRLRYVPAPSVLADVPAPAILVCWHEQILAAVPFLVSQVRAGRRLSVMASRSRDGELTTRIAAAYGVGAARGSTSQGGRAALLALYREVKGSGASVVVLPDGPRGPRREPKAGLVALAQMTGAPIAPMAFAPRRAIRLGSWDRMLLPVPFTRVWVVLGQILRVPRELGNEERDGLLVELRKRLDELTERGTISSSGASGAGAPESRSVEPC